MKINKIILTILILSIVTLVFSGCGGGNPAIPPIPEPEPIETIIPETTNVVDEETIEKIVSITEDQSTIVFEKSTPQLEELASGDIIAMGVTKNTPEGLLRKVKNIIKGAKDSSEIIVETEFVTLEEAVEHGEFNFDIPLQIKNIKEPVSGIEGVKLITDKSKLKDSSHEFNYEINLIAYDGDGNPNTSADNIVLAGYISFDYNIIFAGKIKSHELKNFILKSVVEIETGITISGGGSITVNIVGKSFLPKPIDLGTYTVWLGPIPVVLSPSIDLKWGLNGGIYGTLTTGVTRTDIFTAGLEWNNGITTPIADHNIGYNYIPLETSKGGIIKFSIGPDLMCKIYKVAGPYCNTGPYIKLIADISADPWWELQGGLVVKTGAKLEILKKTYLDIYLTVIDVSKIIDQADGPFGGTNHAPVISSLTANPSSIDINQTTNITCTASDEDVGDTLTYTWIKNGGTFEGSTSGSTITWRAPSTKGNYTVTCEVNDGEASDSDQVIISVGDVNHPPVITSIAVTSATKGQPYSYDVNATDSDGDTLTYSLTTKPSGMSINSSTGLITWTPTVTGSFGVTVKVSDGGLFDTQSFTVTVEENGTSLVSPSGLSVSSYWNTVTGFPSMNLSWNAVSGATGYEMWVRPSGGSSAYLGTRDAPYVTFNSNSLPGGARYVSGTTYYFKVRTVTASGTSDFTSEVPCVAAASPSIGQVQLSSPSNGITLPPMNVTFIWNPVSNATKYEIIIYNSLGQVALDQTTTNLYIIVALGTEETITWKVRAGDNSGNWGAWSSTWSLTIKK